MYAHKKNQKLRKYLREKAKYSHDSGDFKIEESPWRQPAKLIDDLQIFNVNAMQAIVEQHGNRSNLSKNHSRYLDYLEDTKGYLSLAGVPDDAFTQLDELAVDFPNFHEVIDFYREQIALTVYCDGHAFKAQPLLIIGSAGIGKTAFCHRLAKIINTYFSLISFSSMTAGFVLGGMSSSWADGKPGKVVEALAVSHKANPILLLDEIDKAGGDIRHDPLGSLYQLLEP
ncbi:AAA family ATPase (plasmid) [Methylomarinum sp. Ch1-1]|uniref:AAA family ATPase n=1 Tax=Methylomarinum roseum TaxID=3067653 RepID=A0AAU7NP86_9GAMM